MRNIVKIIRPHQWIKNIFVFIPLFFGGSLFDVADWISSLAAFVSFCLAASAVYCFNDIIDVDADRRHPKKCHRPIASGLVGKGEAWVLAAILAVVSLALPLATGKTLVASVIAAYLLLNTAYCLWLKQHAIIDVCVIALGFVMRIIVGGVATDIVLSRWIVMMTFLLTLFLSFAKRRDDVLIMNETGEAPRKNTIHYNLTFINQAITITASMTFVCYIMYTVSPDVMAGFGTENLYLTSIFVLIGLLRYIQITVVENNSGDPTKVIIRDRFTQVIVLLWGLTFMFLIYKRNILG